MDLSENTITLISSRAASLLGEWLGMSPIAKSNNGDRSNHGGMAMLLGAMVAAKAPPPPDNAVERMTAHLQAVIAERCAKYGSAYICFHVDYGPDHEVAELAEKCEIAASWPIKSNLTITIYANSGIKIHDQRGYGDPGVIHHFLEGIGWLVSGVNIDKLLHPIMLKAIERGEVSGDLARIEPFHQEALKLAADA